MQTPFKAIGDSANVDVGSSSGNVLVHTGPGAKQIRIFNNGTATAWIKFGDDSSVAATLAAGMGVGPGVTEVQSFQAGTGTIYAAAIAAGSTGKIYFTPGSGV